MTFADYSLSVAGIGALAALVFGARRGLVMRTLARTDSEEARQDKRYRELRESRRGIACSWIGVIALIVTPNSIFGSFLLQGVAIIAYAILVWIGIGLTARHVWLAGRRAMSAEDAAEPPRNLPSTSPEPASRTTVQQAHGQPDQPARHGEPRGIPPVHSAVEAEFRDIIQKADACDGNMVMMLDFDFMGERAGKVVGWACLLEFNRTKPSERFVAVGHAWAELFETFPSREQAYAWLIDMLGRCAAAKWSTMPHDEDWRVALLEKSGAGAVIGPEVVGCSTKQMCCYSLRCRDGQTHVGDVLQPWDGLPFRYQGSRSW